MAATATNYIINPLELPANQNAAAFFINAGIVGTNLQWSQSPVQTWPDIPTTGAGSRTVCAQAALAAEQARLQARQDTLNRDVSIITTTP